MVSAIVHINTHAPQQLWIPIRMQERVLLAACSSLPRTSLRTWVLRVQLPSGHGCCVFKPAMNIPPGMGAACPTALRAWVLRVQACQEHPSGRGCCVFKPTTMLGNYAHAKERCSWAVWKLRSDASRGRSGASRPWPVRMPGAMFMAGAVHPVAGQYACQERCSWQERCTHAVAGQYACQERCSWLQETILSQPFFPAKKGRYA